MHVRSDRRYRFAVPPAELWTAMTSVDGYRRWWPWLRGLDADGGFAEGARWACVVQPPLPYALRFTIHLDEVEAPRFVTARIDGDITGSAAIDLSAVTSTGVEGGGSEGGGTELRLVSVLAPRSPALRAIARVAAPLARFGHDWVLDNGVRQFERRALP